ncbi:unnamed protein product [Orchesella dallaii]|uniref:Mediator of RNA polymerase II transcription subunit 20 n=1 Tax=Orchesella dallaii TaxID=48710 RepID=A0ABP1PZE5_9HEXA
MKNCKTIFILIFVTGTGNQVGQRTLHILHNSEYPASSFALLEVPVNAAASGAASNTNQSSTPAPTVKTVSLVADNLFDLLVLKMAPVYTSKKIKIEAKGPRFELGDFVVKLGSVVMSQNFKGILVEVEYRPCIMADACWDLLMEFVQGIFGHNAVSSVPRTLQPRMKEVYTPLDTMHQYMDQFSAFRKAAGIR